MARNRGFNIGIANCHCMWTDENQYRGQALGVQRYHGATWYRISTDSKCRVH